MLRTVHADPKSNGTKNAAEKDTWGGKNFFDFVKIQNEKQRYNQKTEHSEDPLCSLPKRPQMPITMTCTDEVRMRQALAKANPDGQR